jgi:hypothetical protein
MTGCAFPADSSQDTPYAIVFLGWLEGIPSWFYLHAGWSWALAGPGSFGKTSQQDFEHRRQ